LLSVAATFAMAAVVACSTALVAGDLLSSVAGVLTFCLVGICFAFVTSPFAVHPRARFASFGGLTNVVLAHNYSQLSERFHAGSPLEIWNAIHSIVVDQLGVKPEAVTPSARFVEDLGMD
jgi:hypothetical protein